MADPWIFTAREDAQFDFQGTQYQMKTGDTYTTDDPCQMKAFIAAWQAATNAGITEHTPGSGAIDALNQACPPGDAPADAGPPVPPADTNPSQGVTDAAPAGGEETSKTLSAPDPPTNSSIEDSPRPSDQSDGRPLSEQYYDQRNPMPDYQVQDELQNLGIAPDDLDKSLQSVIRNEPLPGESHPYFSQDTTVLQSTTSDPVVTFTGQFAHTATDVEIASVGFPIRLVRMYRSGQVYFGPWGYNWDHNYNVYLRELASGSVAVWTGHLSEEVYVPSAGGYEPPAGVFRRLERTQPPADPQGYRLTETGGLTMLFTRPSGWPTPDRIPLTSITDRHGNEQTLSYDSEGRLDQVTDAAGRFLTFQYGSCGLLEEVTDHTGRTWTYLHDDDIEHLVGVQTPAVPDQPGGRTTQFEYDRWNDHPALIHNLTSITDGKGQVVVENEYGADQETSDFGRVVYQNYGGYEATFAATTLQYVPQNPAMANVPHLQVEVVDPGILKIYTFNYRGDLLDERYRLALDRTYRLCARTYRYDAQGNLSERYDPDGHGFRYDYDIGNADPTARGNLLQVTEVPTPLTPELPRVVLTATYESRWQLPQNLADALGSITEYLYDYQLTGTGTGLLEEIRHPVITLPDSTQAQAIEHLTYNNAGQLLHHEVNGEVHDFEYETGGLVAGYLKRHTTAAGGATVGEQYEHDAVGNLSRRTDGLGHQTTYTVDALGEVTRVNPPDGTTWELHWDAAGRLESTLEPRGAYDDPTLAGVPIRHEFSYDMLGHLTREAYAINTRTPRVITYTRNAEGQPLTVTDALGRVLERTFDERGLPLTQTFTDSAGIATYQRHFSYSRDGLLIHAEVAGGPQMQIGYDGFGQPQTLTAPDGASTRYVRDARGSITQAEVHDTPSRGGTLLARRRFEYDERGGNRRQIDVLFDAPGGPFTDVPTVFWLDDAQRPTRINEPGGLVRNRIYGPGGALLQEQDSLGNQVTWTLDTGGRVTQLEVTETSLAGAATGSWTRDYDTRGRVTAEADPLGNASRYVYDERGLITRAINPNGVTMWIVSDAHGATTAYSLDGSTVGYVRDAMGRITLITDPAGAVTGVGHDTQDRLAEMTRDDGGRQTFTYDQSGGIASFTDFDGTRIDYTNNPVGLPLSLTVSAAPGVQATPPTTLVWDGLRRLVQAQAGADTRTLTYDSLGRLTKEAGADVVAQTFDAPGRVRHLTYPDGRTDRIELDPLGRLDRMVQEAAGTLPLATEGIGPGNTLATFDWSGANRPHGIHVAGALDATSHYDGAFRLAGGSYDSAVAGQIWRESSVRDGLGLRCAVSSSGASPNEHAYGYDPLSRVTDVRDGLPTGTVPADPSGFTQPALDAAAAAARQAPFELETTFSYALGDMPDSVTQRDSGGNVMSTQTFTSNALHELATVDGVATNYDDAGNLRQLGTRSYSYDAYRRLVSVSDGGNVTARFTYDALGRVLSRDAGADIIRCAYLGNELLQETSASGIVQYVPGPSLDRPLIRSTSAGSQLFGYDSMGSLIVACDPGGTVLERYRYGIFGMPEILDPGGTTVQPASPFGIAPRFLGRPWVASCGLYDFRDRWYDPSLLVFLQPDPIPFGDAWSPYPFCGFNPINFHDPYGRWLHILLGALVGAAVGGVGAWLGGGDWKDVLAGIGSGAVGGAVTAATGNLALGGAVAGGLMGGWSGGRAGYKADGISGALLGGTVGTVVGAGIGYVGGAVAGRVGNAVATSTSGLINRTLVNQGVAKGTSWVIARYGGMVTGGYAGGVAGGVFSNTTATVVVDTFTGRPITGAQIWDATVHAIEIDGPLNTVGAVGDRFIMIRDLSGNTSNVFGAEGELLVSRDYGITPTRGNQQVTVNGNTRKPDFPTAQTLQEYGAVFEVKNKAYVVDERGGQLTDFSDYAASQNGDLWVFTRPGANVAGTVAGLPNASILPIPQLPLVVTVPVPNFNQRVPAK
jgi:RHS repeat-associated protein